MFDQIRVKTMFAATTVLMVGVLLVATGCATIADSLDGPVRPTATADPPEIADVIPIFRDSDVRYDDKIGFEEHPVVVGDDEVMTVMGTIRRQFLRPDEGSSPLEIMMFYQDVIADLGGTVLYQTRDAQSIQVDGERLRAHFSKERLDRGMSTYVWDFYKFPEAMSEYLSAVVPIGDGDGDGDGEAYVVIAAGRDPRTLQVTGSRFEIVTIDM